MESYDNQYIEELVEKSKRQDTEAFTKLYQMVYKDMYAYAYYTLENAQDAEDVVSDTVLAAFEGIHKLRQASLFRHWIFKILSNQCKKKRKTYLNRPLALDEELALQVDKSGQAIHKALVTEDADVGDQVDIKEAFRILSEEERYIVNAFLFEGYPGEELAVMLGLNYSTLRSKYRRALKKLQKQLEPCT